MWQVFQMLGHKIIILFCETVPGAVEVSNDLS